MSVQGVHQIQVRLREHSDYHPRSHKEEKVISDPQEGERNMLDQKRLKRRFEVKIRWRDLTVGDDPWGGTSDTCTDPMICPIPRQAQADNISPTTRVHPCDSDDRETMNGECGRGEQEGWKDPGGHCSTVLR